MSDAQESRRISILHVTPVIVDILIALLLATILYNSQIIEEVGSPFSQEQDIGSTVYNLIVFMTLLGFGSLILFLLVKIRRLDLLRLFFTASLFLTIYSLNDIIGYSTLIVLNMYREEILMVQEVLSIAIAVISLYVIFKIEDEKYSAPIVLLYGSAAGALLGATLPLWSVITIAIFISLYDIYSVFRGPLKHLVELTKPHKEKELSGGRLSRKNIFRGVTVPFRGLHIGLGDIVFYSTIVVSSYLYSEPSILRAIIPSIGIIIGSYLTFKLLEKRPVLPAVPLPSILASILIIIAVSIGI